jgi:hypothetical protein
MFDWMRELLVAESGRNTVRFGDSWACARVEFGIHAAPDEVHACVARWLAGLTEGVRVV